VPKKDSAEIEEILEDAEFYLERAKKTKSKGDIIRYEFLRMKYYKKLLKQENTLENKREYEKAKESYRKLFPSIHNNEEP